MADRVAKLQQLQCYNSFSDSRDIYLTKNHSEKYSPKTVPTNPTGSWTIHNSLNLIWRNSYEGQAARFFLMNLGNISKCLSAIYLFEFNFPSIQTPRTLISWWGKASVLSIVIHSRHVMAMWSQIWEIMTAARCLNGFSSDIQPVYFYVLTFLIIGLLRFFTKKECTVFFCMILLFAICCCLSK